MCASASPLSGPPPPLARLEGEGVVRGLRLRGQEVSTFRARAAVSISDGLSLSSSYAPSPPPPPGTPLRSAFPPSPSSWSEKSEEEKENGEESKTARHLPWGGGDRSRLARRLLAFLPLPRRMAASFLAGRMRNGGGVCPTGEGESSVRAGTRWWVWTRAVRAKAARTEGLLGVTVICSGFRSMAGVYVLIGVVSGAAG